MIEKGAVLPMFYLPPVEYFTTLIQYKPAILIEREEHFPKQTYRNRANIYSPDGPLTLVVPVIKGSKNHTKFKDVRISNDFKWQRQHWLSLEACYRRSAYFEYYEDDLVGFYKNKFEFLFDYNEHLLQFLFKSLKIKQDLKYTETYEKEYKGEADLRAFFKAGSGQSSAQKHYFQVFEDRHGFLKNLSVVDLLFNQGPHALNYLAK